MRDRLAALARPDLAIIMDRIIDRARREQEWGVPPILTAALTLGAIDQNQGRRLAAFLGGLPAAAIKPSIVPKIADQPWSAEVFAVWRASETAPAVKKAITVSASHGHV